MPCVLFKLAGNASEGRSDGRDVSAVKRLPDLGWTLTLDWHESN